MPSWILTDRSSSLLSPLTDKWANDQDVCPSAIIMLWQLFVMRGSEAGKSKRRTSALNLRHPIQTQTNFLLHKLLIVYFTALVTLKSTGDLFKYIHAIISFA